MTSDFEEHFVECKFPNKELIKKWSKDPGMDPHQMKWWFKNQMLLLEVEKQKQENDALRAENTRIRLENSTMRHKLENRSKCLTCLRNEALDNLLHENMRLREEYQRVTKVLVGILQNPVRHNDDDEEIQGFVDVNLELGLAPALSPASDDGFDD